MAKKAPKPDTIRIDEISIKNYKGIDSLKISFPEPDMLDEPDIFVMGSKNGLGKTSVIECCSMLILACLLKEKEAEFMSPSQAINLPDLFIKAGAKSATISGVLKVGQKKIKGEVIINKDKDVVFKNKGDSSSIQLSEGKVDSLFDSLIESITGENLNPIIFDDFLLFHSYRKVQESNPELGMIVDDDDDGDDNKQRRRMRMHPIHRKRRFSDSSISTFKLEMLRSMMGQISFIEMSDRDIDSNEEIAKKLNRIVLQYTGGTIDTLRIAEDNSIDFRVKLEGSEESHAFDGLSSGQKEIISTTFLIWYYTRNKPCIVFIDEPELHLNAEWHEVFIDGITKLAPKNQYIIATHSRHVMASVDKSQRGLLTE